MSNSPPHYDQAKWTSQSVYEPLLSEKNMTEVSLADVPLPPNLKRSSLTLPSLSEPELARHYTRLSQMTYGVDSGPYLLGSCTMKYNPKFTEDVAVLPGCSIHPDRAPHTIQGTLEILYTLQEHLATIGGMDAVTLQPPAGAAGEFTGILIIKAFHESNGDFSRNEIIIPESAHGTNPASAALGGYKTIEIPSNEQGTVNIDALQAALSENTAALMLTNPNTLGLFELEIQLIASMVHNAGGLLYYDGANLNALLGRSRPRDMGFDIMHYNVHKTFATPHGGGGPGAGPVGVVSKLESFLPAPIVIKTKSGFDLSTPKNTIGKVHGFYGNWLCLVKALAYILRLGDSGLLDASAKAVLNANYLGSKIQYEIPFRPFYHEFVASSGDQDAAEVAKRLLDYGVHPPTTKWPLIVPQALLVEPTESENKSTLDQIAASFNAVLNEDHSTLKSAPNSTASARIDQTTAARSPILSWHALDPSL
jgi:glycine dehydrogenase subunit 2